MPRTRKTPVKPSGRERFRSEPQQGSKMAWVNVQLSDADVDVLERSSTEATTLGAMLLAVADRGYNFSVKYMPKDDSFMCAITGQADDDLARDMGVSSFASTVNDAVLACLYKFEQSCGGQFKTSMGEPVRSTARFR